MKVPSCPLLLTLVVLTAPASALEEQRPTAPSAATTPASRPSEQAKIREALDTLVKKCQEKGRRPGHGFPVLQVAQEVLTLRESIPEIRDADPLLVQVAALLHDIGGGGEANSRPGAALAREILTELNYDPEIVKKVARIVETHHLTGNIVPGVDDTAEWYVVLVADTPKVIKIVGPSADYPAADKRRFDQDQFTREVKERVAELKRIIAKGMTVKARLNGILVTDYNGAGVLDDEVHRQRNLGRRRVIALQIHTHDPLKIRFKDVRIKSSFGGQEPGMGAAPSQP